MYGSVTILQSSEILESDALTKRKYNLEPLPKQRQSHSPIYSSPLSVLDGIVFFLCSNQEEIRKDLIFL
jgi:hypothetical protein